MTAVPLLKPPPLTVDAFLDWELRQDDRWELIDGVAVCRVRERVGHSQIAGNLDCGLAQRLRGSGCRVFREGVKVVAADAVFYPDIVVTCERLTDRALWISHPVLIVEVLSESTERRDRTVKARAFRALPSLRQYVLVAQDALALESVTRHGEDWVAEAIDGIDGRLLFPALGPSPGLALTLAEIYQDTDVLAAATQAMVGR